MKYQYSSSNEYIAIHNPKTNDLKIHKISNKECMLYHTFSLSSNIFTQQEQLQEQNKQQVKEIHWMNDNNTIAVWIEEDNSKSYIHIYDLSLGRQIGTIIHIDEPVLAIRSNPNNKSIYAFVARKDKKNRIICKEYSKEGKIKNKVRLSKTKDDTIIQCIGKTITTTTATKDDDGEDDIPTVLFYNGKKIKSINLNTGTSYFEIKSDVILGKDDDTNNTIVDLYFYNNNNNMLWIRTSQNMILLYNSIEKKD